MSDVFEPELELNQDPVDDVSFATADSVDSEEVTDVEYVESTEDAADSEKKGLVGSFLSMDIYNAMLLLSLIFIFFAMIYLLGVLRTYSEGFPFSDGFPWSTNL